MSQKKKKERRGKKFVTSRYYNARLSPVCVCLSVCVFCLCLRNDREAVVPKAIDPLKSNSFCLYFPEGS